MLIGGGDRCGIVRCVVAIGARLPFLLVFRAINMPANDNEGGNVAGFDAVGCGESDKIPVGRVRVGRISVVSAGVDLERAVGGLAGAEAQRSPSASYPDNVPLTVPDS